MEKVISKRHLGYFYLTISLGSIFLLGLAMVTLVTYIDAYRDGSLEPKQYLALPLSLGICIFTIYLVYCYFRNVPIVSIDKDKIRIGKSTYNWTDATDIQLSGKQKFKCYGNFKFESTTITFNDNTTKVFFDYFYSNTKEMKSFIDIVVINRKEFAQNHALPIDETDVINGSYDEFKGNQFTSYRGIMVWGVLGLTFLFLLTLENNELVDFGFTFCAMSLFLSFAFSYQMNFFLLSKDYLLVKNHNLLWKKSIYRLSDIREIVFETFQKAPYSLRVITKDYKSKLYGAGTLRNKNWAELKDKLEEHGIKVRNELPI